MWASTQVLSLLPITDFTTPRIAFRNLQDIAPHRVLRPPRIFLFFHNFSSKGCSWILYTDKNQSWMWLSAFRSGSQLRGTKHAKKVSQCQIQWLAKVPCSRRNVNWRLREKVLVSLEIRQTVDSAAERLRRPFPSLECDICIRMFLFEALAKQYRCWRILLSFFFRLNAKKRWMIPFTVLNRNGIFANALSMAVLRHL